jgi:hypothetical protein
MSTFHRKGDVQRMLHGHLEAVHLMPFDLYSSCVSYTSRGEEGKEENEP